MAVLLATGAGAAGVVPAASGAAAPGATTPVSYGAYGIDVPAGWQVVDLAAAPHRCVRTDRPAVYLGRPGSDQRCPSRVLGRADTLLVQPSAGAALDPTLAVVRADAGSPVTVPAAAGTAHRFAVEVPDAGVTVTVSYGADPSSVLAVLDGARLTGAPPETAPSETAPSAGVLRAPAPSSGSGGAAAGARAAARSAPPTLAVPVAGRGFDTCAAPSLGAMDAWRASSPYRTVGVYIGGINRGCPQENLTDAWVGSVITEGWALLPIYVGRQSPTVSGCDRCLLIDPSQALAQGVAAASDAVAQARALGIGPSSPIFYDMESYDNRVASSVEATWTFLAGWTVHLHDLGYRSGVYSSAATGISELVERYASSYRPDEVWIANWDGDDTTSDPHVPDNFWVHQRARQYRGGHDETYGGVTINIDSSRIDAPMAASGAGPYVERTYQNLLGRSADPGGFRYWSEYLNFGGSRRSFVDALVGSAEFDRHLVDGDYREILHRGADSSGQSYWAFLFALSGHNDRILASLAGSTEYYRRGGATAAGFVTELYTDVLGRSAGPSAVAFWAGRLAAGESRSTVALSIINSSESVHRRVSAAYWGIVHAVPDPGGLAYWSDLLRRTGDPRPLWAALSATRTAWDLA